MSRSMFAAALLAVVLSVCCTPRIATEFQFEPHYSEPAATDGSDAVLLVEREHFRLFYPEVFCDLVPLEVILDQVVAGMEHVEQKLGVFTQQIDVFIVLRIVAAEESFPEELTIQGVTFQKDGRINVVISLLDGDVGTYPHELTHARLRDLEVRPPRWLEEGLAHFNESPDGMNTELLQILKAEGPLTLNELGNDSGVDNLEMRRRATGWAVAYYLLQVESRGYDEIVHATTLPEPELATAAVYQAFAALPGN